MLWTYGPQTLNSVVLAGIKVKVNISSVGGPIGMELNSNKLEKNPETGLWSGDLVFNEPGNYPITIDAVDGAKNKTSNILGQLKVLPRGTLGSKGEIKVYYFENTQSKYVLWNGSAFGQSNPVLTDDVGSYELVLPAGKYYLEAKVAGKKNVRTSIFTLDQSTIVNMNFDMKPRSVWWPFTQTEDTPWIPSQVAITAPSEQPELPFFALPETGGDLVYGSSFRGVPTVVTVLSTWIPTAADQLTVLDKVAQNKNYRVLAVFAQENLPKIEIFKNRGGYQTQILVDADGEILKSLKLSNVPAHLFINRSGQISKIVYGLLSEMKYLPTFKMV
jgi:hypothetical protein